MQAVTSKAPHSQIQPEALSGPTHGPFRMAAKICGPTDVRTLSINKAIKFLPPILVKGGCVLVSNIYSNLET